MNERIRELWSQSGGHYNKGNQHTWPEYTIDNPEKFAQLIVQECADWLKQPVNQTPSCSTVMNITAERLKEHFGVEQ